MPVEFGPPAAELSQGDLFGGVPSAHVESLATLVRLDDRRFELREEAPEQFDLSRKHQVTTSGHRTHAIVLTHDCEIDKNPKRATLLMAAVRSLEAVPEEHRDGFGRTRATERYTSGRLSS